MAGLTEIPKTIPFQGSNVYLLTDLTRTQENDSKEKISLHANTGSPHTANEQIRGLCQHMKAKGKHPHIRGMGT
jgi:hypothetical protein